MSTIGEKATGLEKVIRWIIPAGLLLLGVKFFTSHIGPLFISFFDTLNGLFGSVLGAAGSFVAMICIVAPIAFAVLYVINNPHMVSNVYLNLCRRLSRAIIKYDPLGHMDSYVERLVIKLKNLRKTKVEIDAKRIELERQFKESEKSFKLNMNKASAAKELAAQHPKNSTAYLEAIQLANHHASMGRSDKENVDKYKPTLDLITRNLSILDRLETNWKYSIEGLKHEIKNKRMQYETLKKAAYGMKQAEDFINGNSKEARDYHMSITILEESVSKKIADIEQFEKDSKMLMQSIDLEKQMNASEGMRLLEQFEANGNSIFLPEDFSNPQAVPAQVVSSRPLNSEFASLLKK
jgi:hypothetical protein